jgi:hypothetical protein
MYIIGYINMREKIPGKNLNLLIPFELLESLDQAKKIMKKNRSSIIRSAIIDYILKLNIFEKFEEFDLNNKESNVSIFKNRLDKKTK